MTVTEVEFNEVVEKINNLPKEGPQLAEDIRLKFYGYYKQATLGPNTTDRPGMFDFVGKAKWNAWNDCKEMSADEARTAYVKLFYEMQPKE